MIFEGIHRRFVPLKAGRGPIDARFTLQESLAVAQVETEHTEMTRAGRRFSAILSTTGEAPVQAVPTTTAAAVLYNPDPARAYVIDSITSILLSGTPAGGASILSIIAPVNGAIASSATGFGIASQSAGGLQSKALSAVAYTLATVAVPYAWVVAPGQASNQITVSTAIASAPGGLVTADVRGRIILPPGKLLGLQTLSGAGTAPLFMYGVNWHEIELDLE